MSTNTVDSLESASSIAFYPLPLVSQQGQSKTRPFAISEADSVKSESGWVPLLLALLHEYTKADSFWEPYLKCYPDFDELDLPLLWPP